MKIKDKIENIIANHVVVRDCHLKLKDPNMELGDKLLKLFSKDMAEIIKSGTYEIKALEPRSYFEFAENIVEESKNKQRKLAKEKGYKLGK